MKGPSRDLPAFNIGDCLNRIGLAAEQRAGRNPVSVGGAEQLGHRKQARHGHFHFVMNDIACPAHAHPPGNGIIQTIAVEITPAVAIALVKFAMETV